MKKIVFIMFIISLLVLFRNDKEEYIIPENAIRFRIIANSNSLEDQLTKSKLKTKLRTILEDNLKDSNSITDTKKIIKDILPNIEDAVKKEQTDYNIKFGYNYFPKKEYRGVTYPKGNYESLVITLGKGLGDNWWCVLYPPLCFIDEDLSDVEYHVYLKDIVQKVIK